MIEGLPLPNEIEGFTRVKHALPECALIIINNIAAYKGNNSDELTIMIHGSGPDSGPALNSETQNTINAQSLKLKKALQLKSLEFKSKSSPNEKFEILSLTDISDGFSFLIRTANGSEYKKIHLSFPFQSKMIEVEYKTSQISSAEEKALAFKSSYLAYLDAYPGIGSPPR
jgi:hypothetical protein